jgi:hypothetical protein
MRFHKLSLPRTILPIFSCIISIGVSVFECPRLQAADPVLQFSDPVLDIFDNRALKFHATPGTGPDPQIVAALESSALGKAYNAIHPERSVLIYDCGKKSPWCGQSDFSFQAIFTEAARIANPRRPDPDGLAVSWYNAASKQDAVLKNDLPRFSLLKDAQLQLLAIANRMDLASFDGKRWKEAEIHFVYGLRPSTPGGAPQNLTVILEFELPSYDGPAFKDLAQVWSDLSGASDDRYAGQLLAALRSSGFSLAAGTASKAILVRSRTNHEVAANAWRLSQLVVDPASEDVAARTVFSPAKLNDQISRDVKPDSRLYLGLWERVQTVVASGQLAYTIPVELLEGPTMPYVIPDQGMGTPPGLCNASRVVRNVLALQQCSGCHTAESKTVFAHIPNRSRIAPSIPSGFLIGQGAASGKNLHPSLVDLYYGNEKVVWPVTIGYQTYAGGSCQTATNSMANCKFHDLARRTLFLAAAKTGTVLPNFLPAAGKFSTFFTE